MPRIDPLQLLKCLSVLLSPEGGILSRDEVPRLVNLMTKFSKKLVSKCVYVLILKNTETSLVDMFMAEGGWTLIQSWLQDAAQSGNWDLVKEILGLLLITPVDVERLKMNCLPKLIKNLSRREDLDGVAQLSNQIVQNWLVIVKGSAHNTTLVPTSIQSQLEKRKLDTDTPAENEGTKPQNVNITESLKETQSKISEDDSIDNNEAINTNTFYKAGSKESKHNSGSKVSSDDDKSTTDINSVEEELKSNEHKDSNEKDIRVIEKDKERITKPSSSSKSKSSSSSSRDKDKEKDKKRSSHSSSSKSKTSSSSSSSNRDKDKRSKDKDRDKKDKDRHRHTSSSKSSSSKTSSRDKKEPKEKGNTNDLKDSKEIKDYKEKQAEKDKDTLQKIKPHTLDKLGRIPKKSSSLISDEKQKENKTENKTKDNAEKDLTKKPSFSILNRKASGEERSKTVKVFNSKMRSTGLEEEVKPPPPRSAKKPTPSVQLPTIPQKRPSPPREPSSMPPEKKIKVDKVDVPERPGSIKLIPPKPKPPVLQESDMFMDALTASAPKKEAKKRKRRLSVTKDAPLSPSTSPAGGDPPTPTSPTPVPQTTSLGLKNIAPINFYQDTLSEEPEKNDSNKNTDNNDENQGSNEINTNSPDNDTPASPVVLNDAEPLLGEDLDPSPPKNVKFDGLKGVLLYTKKKGPKRSIKWKCEEDLVEIRYFELDETERVNVTKTFGDLAKMDISSEREALIMSRKTPNEDLMEPQIMWRMLYVCEQPDHLAPPGSKSLEKDIQFAREKTALPALYYDKRRIPDSPEEPIPENHQMSDPVSIPLEDPESQEIDLRSTPWPEPKGPPPQVEPQPLPPMFQNIPFNPNFNNLGVLPPSSQFVGVPPRFPGPGTPLGPMSAGPGAFVPPNMMHNNMMGPPINQPEMMNQGPINPVMFGPGPDGFIGPGNDPNFQMQQFNGPQGPNLNMYGQNNFHHRGGEGDGRGGYRRGGGGNNGGWVRMNGPRNNWKRGRGGNSRGGRLCKNIQNHGYCRNGDNCPFIH